MRSGPGEARTILLLHIISVSPSKQPLMVRTFLKVYMELGSYFLFLQEQIKDIIICIDEKYLISLCTGKEVWTLDQLASEFACTRSTIQRLKRQLGLVHV
jgi:hypothetical protein